MNAPLHTFVQCNIQNANLIYYSFYRPNFFDNCVLASLLFCSIAPILNFCSVPSKNFDYHTKIGKQYPNWKNIFVLFQTIWTCPKMFWTYVHTKCKRTIHKTFVQSSGSCLRKSPHQNRIEMNTTVLTRLHHYLEVSKASVLQLQQPMGKWTDWYRDSSNRTVFGTKKKPS